MRLLEPGVCGRIVASLLVLALCATSCVRSQPADEERVLVFAAASLGSAFTDLAAAFEVVEPDLEVQLNIGGSSSLREQIRAGAPADVFAPADRSNIRILSGLGELRAAAEPLASNTMQLAVARSAPVTTLTDLANPDLLIGLCEPNVPCGEFASKVLANANIEASVDTFEPDVRSLVTKISAGELDAGIVYVTDVLNAGDAVVGVAIDPALNEIADYPIAVLRTAPNPVGAEAFIAFARSAEGQAILAGHGFGPP